MPAYTGNALHYPSNHDPRYMPVYAVICRYMPVYPGIRRYMPVIPYPTPSNNDPGYITVFTGIYRHISAYTGVQGVFLFVHTFKLTPVPQFYLIFKTLCRYYSQNHVR